MATIIEIQEGKLQHLTDYAEKVLRYGGKLMQCIEELEGKSKFDEYRGVRGRMRYSDGEYKDHEKDHWGDSRYYPERYY
jgi:hypothetical protein